jgi:hypothetical protein
MDFVKIRSPWLNHDIDDRLKGYTKRRKPASVPLLPIPAAQDAYMNRTITSRPASRASYGALILFAVVYIGALAITFAPKGSFSEAPSTTVPQQSE